MSPQTQSALFLLNRKSGTGRTQADVDGLEAAFHAHFARLPHRTFAVTEDHPEVTRWTREFLVSAPGPCLLLAGGGGGTTRALIQGLMEEVQWGAAGLDAVRVGALRLGSGNLVARRFGLPPDPHAGLRLIAEGLRANDVHACHVFGCDFHYPDGRRSTHYALALGGIGPFARTPDDVARARQSHRRSLRLAARVLPLETINAAQYVAFTARRALRGVLRARHAELIEIRQNGCCEQLRILAGFVVNFDVPELPFRAGSGAGDARLTLCLIPRDARRQMVRTLLGWRGLNRRVRRYEITSAAPLEIAFPENPTTTVALDEDTFTAPNRIRFSVAGTVQFVGRPTGRQP
jgi:hypothetical protein